MRVQSRRHRGRFLLALAACALGVSVARADTFRFKDGHGAKGRILAEFRDLYYVQIDSDLPRFLDPRELESVLDEQERPRGDLGRSREPAPLFALDSLVGEVKLETRTGVAPAEHLFGGEGDRVTTGDTGLARVAFPSGAVLKLGASTTFVARAGAESADAFELERGEAFVATQPSRTMEIGLTPELKVRARDATVEVSRTPNAAAWRVVTHSGDARIEGDTFRVQQLMTGQAARIEAVPEGLRITAERENVSAIEVAQGARTVALAPGDALLVDAGKHAIAERTSGRWKLQSVRGLVSIKRPPSGAAPARFVAVGPAEAGQVRLEAGDSVATASGAEAVLLREDGAQVTLAEASELAIEGLDLAAGSLRVDALREPVPLATPAGEARLSLVTLLARRPRGHDRQGVEVEVQKGDAKLPLPAALALAPEGAKLSIEGNAESATLRLDAGTAKVVSRPQPEASDPAVTVILDGGHEVVVRALHKDGLGLGLEGSRELTFGPEKVGATVSLAQDLPRVVLAQGPELTLEKDLRLHVGSQESGPVLEFGPGKERVSLADPGLRLRVGPGTTAFADGTTLGWRDGVAALLRIGDGVAGAIVAARRGDRLEVPRGTKATVGRRHGDHVTLKLQDRRALWIDDGAPPVSERLVAGSSTGFVGATHADAGDAPVSMTLTMPGAPPLTVAGSRAVTVVATKDGEFIVLDDPSLLDGAADQDVLRLSAQGLTTTLDQTPNHIPDLIRQPPPASPVTPP
jgi:hypothetical protein